MLHPPALGLALEPAAKAEVLAVLDDALLFLRGGIDALQDK